MKFAKILSVVVVLAAAGYFGWQYFGEPNGKKYKLDNEHNIYYKGDGMDEVTAKSLANYLQEQEYFEKGKEATVQITKSKDTKDTVNLNFIVDKSKITSDIEEKFVLFGGMIAAKIFKSAPLTVHLSDEHFKEIKNLGYAKAAVDEPVPGTNNTNTQ